MGSQSVISMLSQLSGLIVFAALLILWLKTKSPWLLVAWIAEASTLLFRFAFYLGAGELGGFTEAFIAAWQLAALVMCICMLGFALDYPKRA